MKLAPCLQYKIPRRAVYLDYWFLQGKDQAKEENSNNNAVFVTKNTVIMLKAFTSKINEVQNKGKVPLLRGLFETIERPQQMKNSCVSGTSRVFKSVGLFDIYGCFWKQLKKHSNNIELLNLVVIFGTFNLVEIFYNLIYLIIFKHSY